MSDALSIGEVAARCGVAEADGEVVESLRRLGVAADLPSDALALPVDPQRTAVV